MEERADAMAVRVSAKNADARRLLDIHTDGAPVLSLYLRVPADPPALRELPARAAELVTSAARQVPGVGDVRRHVLAVRRLLEVHGRDWLGHTVAVFVCEPPRLAEAIVLPDWLPERGVFAGRPHVRPLLAAGQRSPAHLVVVVDRRHAWLLAVAGDRTRTIARSVASGVRSKGFGGWHGLDSYRVNDTVIELDRRHYRETADRLVAAARTYGAMPVVVGGHKDTIAGLLAALPTGIRGQVIGSFVADPHAMTPARMRELSGPIIADWVAGRERGLMDELCRQPAAGRTALGLRACLAAVNAHAVGLLLVPVAGLVPGFVCGDGTLGAELGDCPDAETTARPVPDLIEEMAVATLRDDGEVAAVSDPPPGVAARLRFSVAARVA